MAPPAPATLPAALPQANGVLGWSRWQMARPRLAMDLCWMPPGPAMTWQKIRSPSSLLAPSWAVSPLQVAATVGPVGLLAWAGTTTVALKRMNTRNAAAKVLKSIGSPAGRPQVSTEWSLADKRIYRRITPNEP